VSFIYSQVFPEDSFEYIRENLESRHFRGLKKFFFVNLDCTADIQSLEYLLPVSSQLFLYGSFPVKSAIHGSDHFHFSPNFAKTLALPRNSKLSRILFSLTPSGVGGSKFLKMAGKDKN